MLTKSQSLISAVNGGRRTWYKIDDRRLKLYRSSAAADVDDVRSLASADSETQFFSSVPILLHSAHCIVNEKWKINKICCQIELMNFLLRHY